MTQKTATSELFNLEHFYFGQLIRAGKPEGELRVLAATPGIKDEMGAEVAKQALIPPVKGVPDGSWALVRGKKMPFILAQSQLGEAGQSIVHFILTPPEVLRVLGGNLAVLRQLIEQKMPDYDRVGAKLSRIALPQTGPPDKDAQIDHILELMTYTRNRPDVMENLLSAIVQGVQVIVQGAPRDLNSRVGFIQGLLALLPPPARFGVTFTTHSVPSTKVDAQIRFYDDDAPPADTLVYNWPSTKLEGNQVEDAYSHFIISQLRLDAELVIQQTQALTAVAAWRIKRGDGLAEALSYGSYRLAVDNSVRNNLPVEVEDISRVLAEDPTLDDDLRVTYARHLLAFALALGDTQHADPISILLRQNPELEQSTLQQLGDALTDGKAELVYSTLSRWFANPMGPEGEAWVRLTHRSILMHMDELMKSDDLEAVNRFLEEIHSVNLSVEISGVVPKLVEMALPLSVRDKTLAQTTFLLAINYLDIALIQKILGAPKFLAQLPKSLARLIPYVNGNDPSRPPAGLLAEVASAFGEQWKSLVLVRFAEAAMRSERKDLLDTSALAGLVQVALSPWGLQYDQVLLWIVNNLSTPESLQTLDDPGPLYLLQILLARGAYTELATGMINQARVLFPGDLQADYALMVQRLFGETPIPVNDIPAALNGIEKGGIKSLPLAMAYIGALEAQDWSPVLDQIASSVAINLNENRNILNVIHPTAMLSLLKFHVKREDVPGATRLASLFPEVAINQGTMGMAMMIRTYKMMDKDPKLKIVSMELLRRYVRQSDSTVSRQAIVQFGRELGLPVRHALEATLSLKRLMGGVDFVDYADFIHVTAEFLQDTAMAYTDRNNLPSLGALANDMQSLTGGLTDEDRRQIAHNIMALGRAVVVLGEQYRAKTPRDIDKHIEGLLTGKADPKSGVDVLRAMGGYFAKGKRYRVKLDRATTHPLGERSAPMLRDQVEIVNHLLRGIVQAFPPDQEIAISAQVIRDEVESMWGAISLHQQREIVRGLAIDLQRVAELAAHIAAHGDEKSLTDTTIGRKLDTGKQQPKNTIEFYRYVQGYFKSQV